MNRLPVLAGLLLTLAVPAPGRDVPVAFQVNDSLVKDKAVAGASIRVARSGKAAAKGTTDARGRLELALPPGKYAATYAKAGYVTIAASPFTVGEQPRHITTTMSMLLEAAGQARRRRVQIVLNWGSREDQVKDADSHLACACGDGHVYFSDKRHESASHSAELDVDDMDWGGPETLTLLDPPPGEYRYWVDQYSDAGALGASDVVARVVFDDRVAGEFPAPPDASSQTWRPFKAVRVGEDLAPELVFFTREELSQGQDRALPPEQGGHSRGGTAVVLVVIALVVVVAAAVVIAARLR